MSAHFKEDFGKKFLTLPDYYSIWLSFNEMLLLKYIFVRGFHLRITEIHLGLIKQQKVIGRVAWYP